MHIDKAKKIILVVMQKLPYPKPLLPRQPKVAQEGGDVSLSSEISC
jgi:hypothetical protein